MGLAINALERRTASIAAFANLLKGDDPIRGAILVRGVVTAIEPTGTSVAIGGIEHHFCRVTVQVTLPGERPYVAVCSHKLTSSAIAGVQGRDIPHAVPVAIEVDPDEHLHVRVEWGAAAPVG